MAWYWWVAAGFVLVAVVAFAWGLLRGSDRRPDPVTERWLSELLGQLEHDDVQQRLAADVRRRLAARRVSRPMPEEEP